MAHYSDKDIKERYLYAVVNQKKKYFFELGSKEEGVLQQAKEMLTKTKDSYVPHTLLKGLGYEIDRSKLYIIEDLHTMGGKLCTAVREGKRIDYPDPIDFELVIGMIETMSFVDSADLGIDHKEYKKSKDEMKTFFLLLAESEEFAILAHKELKNLKDKI